MVNYIKEFTDIMTDGFIYIDNDKLIRVYNDKAKELFGLTTTNGRQQDSGVIGKGDIVIIADTDMGKDDGRLTVFDLEKIGLINSKIVDGDSVIAIGKYLDNEDSVYTSTNCSENLDMDHYIEGVNIRVHIDVSKKYISIFVNEDEYRLDYVTSIGHMVIIDGGTKNVKFYQQKGYTARKESIRDILDGNAYREKKIGDEIDVIGKNLYEIHEETTELSDFIETSRSTNSQKERLMSINGHPVLCYVRPLYDNKAIKGLMLRLKDITKLTELIEERDEAIKELNKVKEERENNSFHRVIGKSKGITNIKKLLKKASNTKATVLLLGDSGTGKSFIAKEIHENSDRRDQPFIHINCGSIPENLMESELFGYEEGAFTGANKKGKLGYFAMADGGSIFLDEIGEIPLPMQAKLLKVIQDSRFYPLGSNKEMDIDIRIIAATNRNLEDEVVKGRFREDLYYRINVLPIMIPSLNERKEDIDALIADRLPIICERLGVKERYISPEAIEKLREYDFKGNIRELENILERSIILSEGDYIGVDSLIEIEGASKGIENYEIGLKPLKDHIKDCEKRAIISTLEYTAGDKKQAMKILDMKKTSFYDKLKAYKI